MMFLCQNKICSPFSCRGYRKCPAETKAMRKQNDADIAMHAGTTGYDCDICKTGGVKGNFPGWICPACIEKTKYNGDLF